MDHTLKFQPGEVLFHEGSKGEGFYVLRSGSVGVYKQDARVAEIAREGSIFGELSGLLGVPRTSTVKAESACEVLHFACDLDLLMARNPQLIKVLVRSLAKRLAETTEKLSGLERAAEAKLPAPGSVSPAEAPSSPPSARL